MSEYTEKKCRKERIKYKDNIVSVFLYLYAAIIFWMFFYMITIDLTHTNVIKGAALIKSEYCPVKKDKNCSCIINGFWIVRYKTLDTTDFYYIKELKPGLKAVLIEYKYNEDPKKTQILKFKKSKEYYIFSINLKTGKIKDKKDEKPDFVLFLENKFGKDFIKKDINLLKYFNKNSCCFNDIDIF